MNLNAAMNVARCKHNEVIEQGHALRHVLLIADQPENGSDVLHTPAHRHRRSLPLRLGMMAILLLSMLLPDGHALAREQSMRDRLEAWWNETHVGAKRVSTGGGKTAHGGTKRRHAAKRRHDVAVNTRAQARATAASVREPVPRRDRPGRYFLHGPRF
ncbi:hypothetical protein [Bradyrhizobium sp. ORS 285]|uniref:hypothetical protein n=1 Tax=Bradyrhizobium sp. ORS 285 TaxID=115808 RepID=UPI00111203DA|nr:hypothetical protein [Bradyrhizobium sp. ORS 285]